MNASYCSVSGNIFSADLSTNITLKLDENIDIDRFNKILNILEIENLQNKKPDEFVSLKLSAGERQRILFARALYSNFDFLCLDEVFSNIDQASERKILKNLNLFLTDKKTILSIVNRTSDLNFYNKFIIISNNEIFEASKNEAINFLDYGSKQ